MASGTKIRPLTRQLDRSSSILWVIDPRGGLAYLSAAAVAWLGVDGEALVGRRCVAGTPASDEPLDRLAASLSPPPGLAERGWAALRVAPPNVGGGEVEPLETRFVRAGDGPTALTIAVAGRFDDAPRPAELADAADVRRRLDQFRKQHSATAAIATAGTSAASRRLRARLQVAIATRTHVGWYGPTGCGAEAIARHVHHAATPEEPLVVVDGPLMDAELLDATMEPLIGRLADSRAARATAIVRGLDETPAEAQQRLAEIVTGFGGRLRLLALNRDQPRELNEPWAESEETSAEESPRSGILPKLVDLLSPLTVAITPLASRVEDIPVIATALVDSRHAAGEGAGERIGRQALDALVIYPWPGDFEELDESIRHAVRAATQPRIGVEHLPLAIRSYRPGTAADDRDQPQLPLEDALRRYESRLIREALEASGGNRAEAARRLGVSRAKLIRRLADHE